MDAISGILSPYKGIIGFLASSCSIMERLAGILVCYNVYKTKITSSISTKIFVGNLTVSVLGLKFAALIHDSTTYYLYLASIFLQSIYIFIHWVYSDDRKTEIYSPLIYSSFTIGTCYGYAALEDPAKVEFRYGLMLTAFILTVLAIPLKNLALIIEEKDASSIPLSIVMVSTIVSFMWCLYSLAINNGFLLAQSGSSFLICIFQVILCLMYSREHDE